jgi:hypothetical protein
LQWKCQDWVICCVISCVFKVSYFYHSSSELLHVLHCNLYIPLEFIVLSGILSYNWLSIMLQVQIAMLKSVPLNKLVTLCVSGL